MTIEEARKIVYMDERRPIERGDSVWIDWDGKNSRLLKGKVFYIPCATGDCWHIQSQDGRLHYVQVFAIMTREPSKEWYEAKRILNEQIGH